MKKIKYIREITVVTVLVLILIATTIARKYVASFYFEGQGFEWQARAETSQNLPLMFAKVDFHHTGFYGNNCDKETMLYGTDDDVIVSCGGNHYDNNSDLYPNNVNILYYSFNENKFYGGKFKLDYNKISQVAEKMRNEVKNTQGDDKTKEIIFYLKVYPNGKIVVSIDSYFGSRSETKSGKIIIATFQAKPENHDWSVFEREDNASAGGIGNSNSVEVQRNLLLNKYDWSIEVLLPNDRVLRTLRVDTYGSTSLEMDTIKSEKKPTFSNFKYLPKEIDIDYLNKDTVKDFNLANAYFNFDEQEMIKTFETISNNRKNSIKLQLIIKDDTSAVKAILIGNGKSLPIRNTNLERYN